MRGKAKCRNNACIDGRITDLLRELSAKNDQMAGWYALRLVREYLCAQSTDGDIAKLEPASRTAYLMPLHTFLICLSCKCFCEACNELADLILFGCTKHPNIRAVVLYWLTAHPNLQYPPDAENRFREG
ncbi:hypothetical protein [Candidatus Agathobaculum pullicola]|uniref:hypothetical protein n=1 Tax=Candidatus Agathobaculum pullicola TaxID=2838426 RepID=UPI003F8F567B